MRVAASASLLALMTLTLAWELALAPLRPGGSWLALKGVPLLIPLVGILKGRPYTYRWATLVAAPYLAEGCVRAYAERPPSSTLALLEAALVLAFFASTVGYLRALRGARG